MRIIVFLNLSFVILVSCKIIDVKTANELLKALHEVNAGDTIYLEDGHYHNKFIAEKSGTSGSPITITGSKNAVISGYNYGFWLKANYWILKGFTITDSILGIVVENGNHNILENLTVHNIKQEGIHFRYNSADNILRDSEIYKTGLSYPGFGEGVYIGSAVSFYVNLIIKLMKGTN
jgi:parallel beta-helix repeat protein